MTYTTQRILANFLSVEEGLLSKRYIDLCKLFYGEVVGKAAYIATLSVGARESLYDDWCYIPVPTTVQNHRDIISISTTDWFPGKCLYLGTEGGFHIYRATRFGKQYNTRDAIHSLHTLMTTPESTQFNNDLLTAFRYMFYETLYDSVSAQGYTRPAVGSNTDSFVKQAIADNPLLSQERWMDPRLSSVEDVRNLTSYM